jgi:hypothetical protein
MSRTFRKTRPRVSRIGQWLSAKDSKGNSLPLNKRNVARDGKNKVVWVCNCDYCLDNKLHHLKRHTTVEWEMKNMGC